MAHELEYIVKDALMLCDKGAAPGFFRPTYNMTTKINSCLVTTKMDMFPIVNIPSFGVCSMTQKPCLPIPTVWQKTYKVKVRHMETLLYRSYMPCGLGGKIEFATSGQIPLPADTLEDIEKMQEQGAEEEEEGFGWLDAVELVPVIGSIVGAVREGIKGNWGMMAMNIGFLALDVAGIFTAGTTTVAATAAKATVKAGVKVAAKATAKSAAKQVGKSGLKTGVKLSAKGVMKAFRNNIDNIVAKCSMGKLCVFACFPAGTPVHTENGILSIEKVKAGDKVWAYNEKNRETALKEVLQTMEREADVTLRIRVGDEEIETTAEHPFYTQDGWKDAADLSVSDVLQTKEHKQKHINSIEYSYKSKKVFNFAVADWQTYFVGLWAWLVHNAQKCLSEMILESQKWFQNIMRGNSFNNVMNAFTELLAESKGEKFFLELPVLLKNGKQGRIDSLIKGVAMIERKATDLAKVTVKTAKSYINDAAKYAHSISEKTGKVTEQIYLHVENMKGVSPEVLTHAHDMGVKIIDDISQIKFK